MKILKFFSLILILTCSTCLVSVTQTKDPAKVLQSFEPRKILLNDFLKVCNDNSISLLKVEDKMGNHSKKTRFSTFEATLIYKSQRAVKKLIFQYYFKDDTLLTVKSF